MARKKSFRSTEKETEKKKTISTELAVALVGLAGTVIVAIFGYMNTRTTVLTPIHITQTAEARQAPNQAPPTSTLSITETAAPTQGMTPSPMVEGTALPTPQIVSQLPQAQKAIVQKAAEALLQASQALPLIVRDDFDNNDYGWPESKNIYTGGIECNVAITEGVYKINIHTTNGPAFCFAGNQKVASDFILIVEQQLVNKSNANLFIYYRYTDDANFYDIVYNPQTQTFSAGVTKDGIYHSLIDGIYVEEINTNAINKISLLTLGNSHVIYINDKLITIFTDDQLKTGQLRFYIYLLEANKEDSLLLDHFELRGQ
jgi:hypothetical protein